ncbi:zf-HC2 domain-containing protein [uncultured Tateyamaria sp.]|uniref:anti-sigma factor family protein n=1 Tax=uncultured Tateyamaria sp. TaxID=455651 RepID=UPI002622B28F|nr:zf-HC2 domain-containing protein [uncultured Tateyamaria sp.]
MSKSGRTMTRRMHGVLFKFPGMITCNEFEDFILVYLEDELPPAKKRLFELHLKVCKSCRLYLAAYRRTLAATKALQKDYDALEETVPQDLIEAILATKDDKPPR